MQDQLDKLMKRALSELEDVTTTQELQNWRVEHLGRSAEIGNFLQGLRELAPEDRPAAGRLVNEVKSELEAAYAAKKDAIRHRTLERSLEAETSMP